MYLKRLNEISNVSCDDMIVEMAHINNKDKDTSPSNPSVYNVDVRNDEGDTRPPHIHVAHKTEQWGSWSSLNDLACLPPVSPESNRSSKRANIVEREKEQHA